MRGKNGVNKAVPTASPVVEPLEQRRLLSVVPITLATLAGPVAPRVAVDAAGDVFGTTLSSGTSAGTIYEIPTGTSTIETLANFGPNSTTNIDGIDPSSIAIDAAGNLFGGTASGGTQADGTPNPTGTGGTLWELPRGGTSVLVLQTYGHTSDYYEPTYGVSAVALDAADDVFADIVYDDGLGRRPYIEEYLPAERMTGSVANATNTFSYNLIPNFAVDAAGDAFVAYQTTTGGVVDQVPAGTAAASLSSSTSAAFSTVATLSNSAGDGLVTPTGVAFDANGNAYITTTSDAVFEVPANTSSPKLLASINYTDPPSLGATPNDEPVVDAAGDVFEVTDNPTVNGYGGLLELPAGGSALRVLMTFDTAAEAQQVGGLTVDAAGDVFGTMPAGAGTAVFELPAAVLPTSGSALVPTVARSTLPTAVVTRTSARGSVAVTLTNGSAATYQGTGTVTLYAVAGAGAGDAPGTPIAHVTRRLSLRAGRPATVSVPVRGLVLPAGTYAVVARVVDASGGTSTAATDMPLVVSGEHVSLSATVTAAPASVMPGETIGLTLKLTNGGNMPSTGLATLGVFLSADGSSLTLPLAAVAKRLTVRAGGPAVTVRLRVRVPPTAAAGTLYPLVTVVQPNAMARAVATTAVAIV